MSEELLPIDQRLMGVLSGYGPRGIWPSVPEMARKLEVSDRTVQRSLRRLERFRLVVTFPVYEQPNDPPWAERQRKMLHSNRQTTNTYMLTGRPVGNRSPDPGDTVVVGPDPGDIWESLSDVTGPGDTKTAPETPVTPGETAAQTPVTRPIDQHTDVSPHEQPEGDHQPVALVPVGT